MEHIHEVVESILVSHEQIVARAKEMGKEITEDYKGKQPIFIGLLNGSVPFMAELIKHIECDIMIDFMKVKSYSGTESTGKINIVSDLTLNIKDKHLLIVEDIVDSGLTLSVVRKELLARGAKSVEIATMLNKQEGRTVKDMQPKYIGFEIPKKYVIGFGLDYNDLYRNLNYVAVLKRSVYERD